MASEDKGSGLMLFVTGAAIGAAFGVLFAPRSGRETREELGNWLEERREKGSELLDKVNGESLMKSEALVAAAKAAKSTYSEINGKPHHNAAA